MAFATDRKAYKEEPEKYKGDITTVATIVKLPLQVRVIHLIYGVLIRLSVYRQWLTELKWLLRN